MSPLPWIAMAAVGLTVGGLSILNLSEKATSLPRAMDAVVGHEKELKRAKTPGEKAEAKRNLQFHLDSEGDEIQTTAPSAGRALLGLGIGGFGDLKSTRRKKTGAAPVSAVSPPLRG